MRLEPGHAAVDFGSSHAPDYMVVLPPAGFNALIKRVLNPCSGERPPSVVHRCSGGQGSSRVYDCRALVCHGPGRACTILTKAFSTPRGLLQEASTTSQHAAAPPDCTRRGGARRSGDGGEAWGAARATAAWQRGRGGGRRAARSNSRHATASVGLPGLLQGKPAAGSEGEPEDALDPGPA